MLTWLRQRRSAERIARALYGSSVTAAREPAFYRDLGVPDTLAGRFEMVVVQTFLLMHRLSGEGEAGRALAQALGEAMVEQLDDDMRQMGVSDITVPKKIRKAASAAYGRFEAYAATIEASDQAALAAALLRNVYGDDATCAGPAGLLAGHVMRAAAELRAMPAAPLLQGEASLPTYRE
jgi:cytochrome b pre-mRNA-processing protein 3